MQSLPLKTSSKEERYNAQQIDDLWKQLQETSKPKYQSAKVHREKMDDIDYDLLRQQTLRGRRSSRRQVIQAKDFDDDDYNIPDEVVDVDYLFKLQ